MCCHTSMHQHPWRWVWVWLAQHLFGMWVSPSSTELHDLPFAHSHLCELGKGANKSKMGRSLSMLMFEDFMLMTWSRLPHLAISWVSRLCPPSSQINWLHTTAKNLKSPWIMLVIICSLWSCLLSTLSTLPEAKKEESPQRWPLRFRLSFLCQLWQQFC